MHSKNLLASCCSITRVLSNLLGVFITIYSLCILTTFEARGQAETAWGEYLNSRFHYHVCYPTDIMKPQEESPSGDGRVFASTEGASLTVYGRNNILDETEKVTAKEIGTRLAGFDGKITYSSIHRGWFVVSGTNTKGVFYAKGLLKDGQYKIFELAYPSSKAALYDKVAAKISTCFGSTNP